MLEYGLDHHPWAYTMKDSRKKLSDTETSVIQGCMLITA